MKTKKFKNTNSITSLVVGGALLSSLAFAKGHRSPIVEQQLSYPQTFATPVGNVEAAPGKITFYQIDKNHFDLATATLNDTQSLLGLILPAGTQITLKDVGNVGMGLPGVCDLELASELLVPVKNEMKLFPIEPTAQGAICLNQIQNLKQDVRIDGVTKYEKDVEGIVIKAGPVSLLRRQDESLGIVRATVAEATTLWFSGKRTISLHKDDLISHEFYDKFDLNKLFVVRTSPTLPGPNGLLMGYQNVYSMTDGRVLEYESPAQVTEVNGLKIKPLSYVSLYKNGNVKVINELAGTDGMQPPVEVTFGAITFVPQFSRPVFLHDDQSTLMGLVLTNVAKESNLEEMGLSPSAYQTINNLGYGFVGFTPHGTPKVFYLEDREQNKFRSFKTVFSDASKALELVEMDPANLNVNKLEMDSFNAFGADNIPQSLVDFLHQEVEIQL